MEWNNSYSASWRVYRVNRDTWADSETLPNVDSVSITKTADGSLLESGSIETTSPFESDYYRIVMVAQQGSEAERVDVATLLFDDLKGEIDYNRTEYSVSGYSVLYPASVTAITTGEYAPKGVDGVQYAKELLENCINAPVEADGSFTLNDHLVHELGSSVLDAVWAVLEAGGYVMQIHGDGVVHICKKPDEPSLTIDSASTGLLMNGISFSADSSQIPNRYIVISDDVITTAINDDPNSPVSIRNRGYAVDLVDTSPTPVNGQTLSDYANSKLEELSIQKDERSYSREYAPDVYPYSLVRASINGLTGDLRVSSQSINCEHGISVNEKAYREIKLYG